MEGSNARVAARGVWPTSSTDLAAMPKGTLTPFWAISCALWYCARQERAFEALSDEAGQMLGACGEVKSSYLMKVEAADELTSGTSSAAEAGGAGLHARAESRHGGRYGGATECGRRSRQTSMLMRDVLSRKDRHGTPPQTRRGPQT